MDPHKKWELEDWFQTLIYKAQSLGSVSTIEKRIVVLSLRYLKVESMLVRYRRDPKAIEHTWRAVHPLLEKNKMLDEFKENVFLKNKLSFFVKSGWGIDADKRLHGPG